MAHGGSSKQRASQLKPGQTLGRWWRGEQQSVMGEGSPRLDSWGRTREGSPADIAETVADWTVLPYSGEAEGSTLSKAAKLAKGLKGAGKKAAAKSESFVATPGMLPHMDRLDRALMRAVVPEQESDITRSFLSLPQMKGEGTVPAKEVQTALKNRATYRAEPQTLPKKPTEMSPQEWEAFGAQHGADFTQNPMQSLGVSDIKTRRELMAPGGMEGKFTIPDLFQIKANNFDPTALGKEKHTELMKKFIRTYERPGGSDEVDKFNDLNFSLLSPNAPLTQNEFLAQRLRARTPEDLERIAAGQGISDAETGVGAAARGGLGVKGTADLGNQAKLAEMLRAKPEMFSPGEGETIRDVGYRVMNQVPGLSTKTASLGVPWMDLAKANTSAADLHMIRQAFPSMMKDDPEFAARVTELAPKILARGDKKVTTPEKALEAAAINVVSDHPEWMYRLKSGELHPQLPDYLQPEKLAFEPEKFTMPSKPYQEVMSRIDASRGANPEIEMFPEQWRLWDTYRGRVEPHEMAHPDWRKLPKQSFNELQDALTAHKELGYTSTGGTDPTSVTGDWRKLYYGRVDPRMAAGLGVASGAATGGMYAAERVKQLRAEREAAMKKALEEQTQGELQ